MTPHKSSPPNRVNPRTLPRLDTRPPQTPTVEAAPNLLRIGKESLPDPSEPLTAEIVYAERVCPVCGKPVSDKQTYDKDACRKQAARGRPLSPE